MRSGLCKSEEEEAEAQRSEVIYSRPLPVTAGLVGCPSLLCPPHYVYPLGPGSEPGQKV